MPVIKNQDFTGEMHSDIGHGDHTLEKAPADLNYGKGKKKKHLEKRVTIMFSPEMHAALEQHFIANGLTISGGIRHILSRYMADKRINY